MISRCLPLPRPSTVFTILHSQYNAYANRNSHVDEISFLQKFPSQELAIFSNHFKSSAAVPMSLCSRQSGPAAFSQGQETLFRADLPKFSSSSEIPIINTPVTQAQVETLNINFEGNFAATAALADVIITFSA